MTEAPWKSPKNGIVEEIRQVPSPKHSRILHNPVLLVTHYTASGGETGSSDAKFFQAKNGIQASAHFVIGRQGDITQCVPLGRQAWHAGKSFWRGRPSVNNRSIGVELDNWGWLDKRADGKFYSHAGVCVDDSNVIEAYAFGKRYWEAYTEEQFQAYVELGRFLFVHIPSLEENVGHSDIAPDRKLDPGPAWNMKRFIGALEGREDKENHGNETSVVAQTLEKKEENHVSYKTVTATRLNIRAAADGRADKMGQFIRGTQVTVIYNGIGWDYVAGSDTNGTPIIGWVSDQYLE